MRSATFIILIVGLFLCSNIQAARGVRADALKMLGHQAEGKTFGTPAQEGPQSMEQEVRQLKSKDLNDWTFNINLLPKHLQKIFNSTAPSFSVAKVLTKAHTVLSKYPLCLV